MTELAKKLSFEDVSLHMPEYLQIQEVLAAFNSPSLANFRRALEVLGTSTRERFVKVQQVARERADGGGDSDLRRLKRQFSNLKNSFLLVDVKEGFVDGLTEGYPDGSEEERLAEHEQRAREIGELVKSLKEKNKLLHSNILQLVDSVAKAYNEHGVLQGTLSTQLEALAQSAVADHATSAPQPGPAGSLSEGECRALLASEAETTRMLEAKIATYEAESAELQAAINSEEDEVEALKLQCQDAAQASRALAATNTRYMEELEWCKELTRLTSALGGVALEGVCSDGLMLRLTTCVGTEAADVVRSYGLRVFLEDGTTLTKSAVLDPPSTEVADIVTASRESSRGLAFLVSEVLARLDVCLRRELLIAAAQKEYPMRPVEEDQATELWFQLEPGVDVALQVPAGWPANGELEVLQLAAPGAAPALVEAALRSVEDLAPDTDVLRVLHALASTIAEGLCKG